MWKMQRVSVHPDADTNSSPSPHGVTLRKGSTYQAMRAAAWKSRGRFIAFRCVVAYVFLAFAAFSMQFGLSKERGAQQIVQAVVLCFEALIFAFLIRRSVSLADYLKWAQPLYLASLAGGALYVAFMPCLGDHENFLLNCSSEGGSQLMPSFLLSMVAFRLVLCAVVLHFSSEVFIASCVLKGIFLGAAASRFLEDKVAIVDASFNIGSLAVMAYVLWQHILNNQISGIENATQQDQMEAKRKSDRIMNHNIKNILAETFSTLMLYRQGEANLMDLHRSAKSLKRALRFIQNTLKLSKLLYDNSDQTVVPIDTCACLSVWTQEHCTVPISFCGNDLRFCISEGIAVEMFLDLSLDNAVIHGKRGGCVKVDCTFDGSNLSIDICNDMPSRSGSSAPISGQFSTGLGLGDLQTICSLRNIKFESRADKTSQQWHSTIILAAAVVDNSNIGSESKLPSEVFPHAIRVAIVDDQMMIIRFAQKRMERKIRGIIVEPFLLNNTEVYKTFIDSTIPSRQDSWDIVLLDQHYDLTDGVTKYGTDLLEKFSDVNLRNTCVIMHTGNNSDADKSKYIAAGCQGVIGKGEDVITSMRHIYDAYLKQV